jgi:hypothetical protein
MVIASSKGPCPGSAPRRKEPPSAEAKKKAARIGRLVAQLFFDQARKVNDSHLRHTCFPVWARSGGARLSLLKTMSVALPTLTLGESIR